MKMKIKLRHVAHACMLMAVAGGAIASSHREAPFITTSPKVDGTDFYMFNSYEAGKSGNVTLIANYLPLQDAYGGPNYFSLDPNAPVSYTPPEPTRRYAISYAVFCLKKKTLWPSYTL
mgnify:CR=1 FL=1